LIIPFGINASIGITRMFTETKDEDAGQSQQKHAGIVVVAL
jgi:hypothetical protein